MAKQTNGDSYNFVFILKSDDEEATGVVEKYVADQNGEVAKKEAWGKKGFAYPIKKQSNGYYFDWTITLPKSGVKEFKKSLDFSEHVLRYLLLNE